MKKIRVMLVGLVVVISMAQAAACPKTNYDGCTKNGYSIVEVEPNIYWPHNEMEAAHWTGAHAVHHRVTRRHHRTRYVRRHHRAKHCSCRCR